MYCERCRILYVPGIEECDNCGRRLRPLRPGRSPSVVLVWLLLYTVIPVVEVAAASTYLTRFLRVADAKTPTSQAKAEPAPPAAQVKAQPAPRADKDKPSPAPPEAGGPAPLYEVRPDMPHDPVSLVELMKAMQPAPDPLQEPVALDAEGERLLANVHAYLNKNRAIEDAAVSGLGMVAERVGKFEGRIKDDLRTGGPMAAPEFRRRWKAVLELDGEMNGGRMADPYSTLEDDLLAGRPVLKVGLKDLAEDAKFLRERLGRALTWERSLAEILPAFPRNALYFSGDLSGVDELRGRLGDQAFLREAFSSERYVGDGPRGRGDVYVTLLFETGLVRAAYRAEEMDVREAAAGLEWAEKLLRNLVEGGPVGRPESPAARAVVPPITAAAPKVTPKAEAPAEAAAAPKAEVAAPPPPPPFPGRPRQWTDVRGKNFYGRIAAAKGGEVRLEGPDGRWFWTPVLNLSDYDRYYVESFLAGREPDYEPPVRRRPKKMDPAEEVMKLFPRFW